MRISATLLESYRRWVAMEDGDYADQTEQELLASIRGEFRSTPALRIGRAYHAILEHPQLDLSGDYTHDAIRFDRSAIDPMLDRIAHSGVFEVKTTRELLIPSIGAVTLVAKADHLAGAHLSEVKTTLDQFNPDKYLASAQWRIMAWLFEPAVITYHVACLRDDGNRFGLRSIESFSVYPYSALETDVRSLVRHFCGYVQARGLESYLIPVWERVTR